MLAAPLQPSREDHIAPVPCVRPKFFFGCRQRCSIPAGGGNSRRQRHWHHPPANQGNIAHAERRGMDKQRANQRARTASETASERVMGLASKTVSETVSEASARSTHLLESHKDVGFRMGSLSVITVCCQPTSLHVGKNARTTFDTLLGRKPSVNVTTLETRGADMEVFVFHFKPHVYTLFAARMSFQKRSLKKRCHPPSRAIRHRMTWAPFLDRDALF